MPKPSKPRNNIIEFGRFIYSLLVLGYHVQFSYDDDKVDAFENGALAVEYYFLLSGYFLARSLEKLAKDEINNLFKKTFYFMKNKITALLNVHILSIVVMIIVLACYEKGDFWDKFVPGIPSIFLVHMIIVWTGDFDKALIIPEWYLSAMLISMLFMVPIYLLFTKIVKTIYATLILIGLVALIAIISGLATKWAFNENLLYDIRAWGEMTVRMLAYFLSEYVKKKDFGNGLLIFLKIIEIIGYIAPAILGITPIHKNNQGILMGVTIVCIFCALFITFTEKGNVIKNEKVNKAFGYLGAISLPIYLFHPVIISFIDYNDKYMPRWEKFLIVLPVTLVLALLYRFIADLLNKKLQERKSKNNEEVEKKNKIPNNEGSKDKNIIEINDGNKENLVSNK